MGGEKVVCFENQILKFSDRTNRTNRTLALIYKACVLYGRKSRCTVAVRSKRTPYTVEALIYKAFVRIVRFVRKFLYTHIYREYIFGKFQSSARARVRMFTSTVQSVQTVHCP